MNSSNIFENLLNIYHENKLSHAYLFETNDVESCYKEILQLIKKMVCKSEFKEQCYKCELCHLIDENNLPSIITVKPDGKSIKKEAIEDLKQAFSLMPSYIPYNIYIIKYPEKMNATAFNKMLKFLEEPEDNIIGFYITANKDNIASTIISRCEVLKYKSQNKDKPLLTLLEDDYETTFQKAKLYYKMLESNDSNIIWYNNSVLLKEISSQEQIVVFLNLIYNMYKADFIQSKKAITIKKMNVIAKYLEELNYNVNLGLLLDSLAIEIGDFNEK